MKLTSKILISLLALVAVPRLAAADFLVERLDGPVTPAEIAAFKAQIRTIEPGTSNKGNNYVYGGGGRGVEAMLDMYEVTGDPEILDKLIYFADAMLAGRNDRSERRVIFTGHVEPCWPNKGATAADAGYCGTENGDVVGHIAGVAAAILRTPVLWNVRVPGGDPRHFGRTYLARAKTYVREGDRTIDELLLPRFVDPTSKRFHLPTGSDWDALGPRYAKDAGHGAPWNQQAMLANGFQRLAECHEILGDDAARVGRYDQIVRASMDWFRSCLVGYKKSNKNVYKWSYAAGDIALKYMEDVGHGGYDIWGIVRAHGRGTYGVPTSTMKRLAATVRYVLAAGTDGKLAGRVDGGGGRKKTLGSTWLYLAQYDPAVFPLLVNEQMLKDAKKRIDVAARILWMKHFRAGGFSGLVEDAPAPAQVLATPAAETNDDLVPDEDDDASLDEGEGDD